MEDIIDTEEIKEIKIIDPYGFIYITACEINGKKYIGKRMFKYNWQNYLGSGTVLLRAIKKYGKENFSREIIAVSYTREELNELEIEFIKNHSAVESLDYYNINYGGEGGSVKGENNPMYGKHHSEKTKKKMSESEKGEKRYMFGKKYQRKLNKI